MRIELSQAAQALPTSGQTSNLSPAGDDAHACVSEEQARLLGVRTQIEVLVSYVSQFPEVRQEKVTALQQVILGGGYQPTADQLAQAMFVYMLVKPAA
jgi:hypothetical protein